ncbi:MAG TPA: DUF6503 family protein [Thermoanaerobaculia bacterium]|nr:DUF6503 family protein [Thermoanaerobaculia bacterium]
MFRPAALVLVAALSLAPRPGAAHPHSATPTAEEVAGNVMQALGGKEAWDKTRFLRFSFAGRRTHWWDKWTGQHRLEGQNQEGKKYVVLENVNSKEGVAWLEGQKLEGEAAKEMLERAYGAWINDTYWLLMPYKLQDPGVNLSYVGEEDVEGKKYDKLLLTFQQVGLTPGDRYWAYINRDSHLMDRWAYVLQSMEPGSAPTVWRWEGWQKYGNVMLASKRVQLGTEPRTLELGDIAVTDTLPDAVFTSPEPVK